MKFELIWCAVCGMEKMSLTDLEQHVSEEHLQEWQPFKCRICAQCRPTEHLLIEHHQACHQSKPFSHSQVSYVFYSSSLTILATGTDRIILQLITIFVESIFQTNHFGGFVKQTT